MQCIQVTLNPANNTVVTRSVGDANVTFECEILDDDGTRRLTQWAIVNFRGVEGGVDIATALPNTIILDGAPNSGAFFDTFHNRLIVREFIGDLHQTTLFCGFSEFLNAGQFFLRTYSKYSNYLKPQLAQQPHLEKLSEAQNVIFVPYSTNCGFRKLQFVCCKVMNVDHKYN